MGEKKYFFFTPMEQMHTLINISMSLYIKMLGTDRLKHFTSRTSWKLARKKTKNKKKKTYGPYQNTRNTGTSAMSKNLIGNSW